MSIPSQQSSLAKVLPNPVLKGTSLHCIMHYLPLSDTFPKTEFLPNAHIDKEGKYNLCLYNVVDRNGEYLTEPSLDNRLVF